MNSLPKPNKTIRLHNNYHVKAWCSCNQIMQNLCVSATNATPKPFMPATNTMSNYDSTTNTMQNQSFSATSTIPKPYVVVKKAKPKTCISAANTMLKPNICIYGTTPKLAFPSEEQCQDCVVPWQKPLQNMCWDSAKLLTTMQNSWFHKAVCVISATSLILRKYSVPWVLLSIVFLYVFWHSIHPHAKNEPRRGCHTPCSVVSDPY